MDNHPTSDLHRIALPDKEIILVGTAHISQDSVDTVRRVIDEEHPDAVCVELDEQRLQSLKNQNQWESLNIIQVIKKGQAPFLMANLALASYQKRMGLQTGVKPGAELAAAAELAEEKQIRVALVDRNIRTTLLRAWRKTGLWKKMNLLATLLASFFENNQIDEAELARLRQSDTLSAMLEEMGAILPSVKTILVDERDIYMAHHIRDTPGNKIVAVVGAAHLPGIGRLLTEEIPAATIEEISTIPEKSTASKIVPWLIPATVVLLFIVGFFFGNPQKIADAALAWTLSTGLLSALGSLLAFGHPLTILASFLGAPITTLHPAIGVGFITGIVQALVAAPTVRDLERIPDDMTSVRGWWGNRMTRVLLVFFFSSFGAAAGTLIAFRWLKEIF